MKIKWSQTNSKLPPQDKDIMWLNKDQNGALYDESTDSYVTLLPSLPDYVRLPVQLGDHTVRVLSGFQAQCPQRCGTECIHYALENGLYVANCTKCPNPYGFYQRKG